MENSVNTLTKIRTGYLCWNMPEENLKLISKSVILQPKSCEADCYAFLKRSLDQQSPFVKDDTLESRWRVLPADQQRNLQQFFSKSSCNYKISIFYSSVVIGLFSDISVSGHWVIVGPGVAVSVHAHKQYDSGQLYKQSWPCLWQAIKCVMMSYCFCLRLTLPGSAEGLRTSLKYLSCSK